jgi:hypothetical protein
MDSRWDHGTRETAKAVGGLSTRTPAVTAANENQSAGSGLDRASSAKLYLTAFFQIGAPSDIARGRIWKSGNARLGSLRCGPGARLSGRFNGRRHEPREICANLRFGRRSGANAALLCVPAALPVAPQSHLQGEGVRFGVAIEERNAPAFAAPKDICR